MHDRSFGFASESKDAAGIHRATISDAIEVETDSDISSLNRDDDKAVEEFYSHSSYSSFLLPVINIPAARESFSRIGDMFSDAFSKAHDSVKPKLEVAQEVAEDVLPEVAEGNISAEEAEEVINESIALSEIDENMVALLDYYQDEEPPAEQVEAVLEGWSPQIDDGEELVFVRKDVVLDLTAQDDTQITPVVEVATTDKYTPEEIIDLYFVNDGRTNTEKIADSIIKYSGKMAYLIEKYPFAARWGIPALSVTIQGLIATITGGLALKAIVAKEALALGIAEASAEKVGHFIGKLIDITSNKILEYNPTLSEERAKALAGAAVITATVAGVVVATKLVTTAVQHILRNTAKLTHSTGTHLGTKTAAHLAEKSQVLKNIRKQLDLKTDLYKLGKKGGSRRIVELKISEHNPEKMFKALSKGGYIDPNPPAKIAEVGGKRCIFEFANGEKGFINYRPYSKSGPATIDINIKEIKIDFKPPGATKLKDVKLKFVGE